MPTEITFIFRKFEGYIHSGIGSRSVPVGRLAGRPAGCQTKTSVRSEFLKFSSGQILQHLACLNEDIALLVL